MIIGVNGVPLTYVIRENDEPVFDEEIDYDDAIIEAVALEEEEYKIEAVRRYHEDYISVK